jgi:hypothetical protein
MKLVQRLLMGSGALALTILALMLAAPRAAHAIAATLVQVVNTATNPAVSQDVSKLASQNVSLTGDTQVNQQTSPLYTVSADGSVSTLPYTVPTGQTLIVTSVDLNPNIGVTSYSSVGLGLPSNSSAFGFWEVAPAISTQFVYPAGIVIAGGTTPQFLSGNPLVLRLHGYLTSN